MSKEPLTEKEEIALDAIHYALNRIAINPNLRCHAGKYTEMFERLKKACAKLTDKTTAEIVATLTKNYATHYGRTGGNNGGVAENQLIQIGMAVRRLTPLECERLQGFPDNFTNIIYHGKPAKDGPRYKALGNSMAVPVIRWILGRMDLIDQISPL